MKSALTPRNFAYLFVLTALNATSFGLGFRIPDQGAAATARGDAFAATADDPSAIYYNPAGISQLDGTRVLLGAYAISLKTRVSLDTPGENSSFSSKNTQLQSVPQFYATWKLKNAPITLGLGVYAPFGFALEYPDDTPLRTLAHKGSIQYSTVNPVIAWKICDTLSVAGGVTVNYSKADLEQGVLAPGDEFKFQGDGFTTGFNAGIMWDPHRMHHFGLTYRSATRVTYSGHTYVNTDPFSVATPFGKFPVAGIHTRQDADATFDLPQTITAGYSFRPTDDWNFEFDLDWADWGTLNTVHLHQTTSTIDIPFNWRSSFMYEFGVTKKFAHNFRASVGYVYSKNSVPNEVFSPAIPDSDRHIFSAGFGQSYDHFNWNLAYQYTYGPARTIDQGSIADGAYRFDSHAVTLSLGYNF
ncbi:MAG: outer membrane protein transport protein [Chthoniobacter sp.]|uniref:OmpP1/FadL family transporter n=1 Tax=Chthoniobacter sp. TaxID=2510640 RepID=UPI0032A43F21